MMHLGRYEVLRELGHGAMGRVFLGRDPQIGREVALKTVNLSMLDTSEREEFCKRFFHEAQAAGRLLHPGIVTIFDMGEDPATKTPFLVMEYVEGSTLDAVMAQNRFAAASALQLGKELAEALDYAHAHGIVHRDIKPSNILVTLEGHAKVTDFGVARLPTSASTDSGAVLGTPHYMAPEQLSGKRVDGRSDLFALGTILYQLLTGRKPFSGDSLPNIIFHIMFTDPALPSSLEATLGPDYDYMLNRALAKEPERRYQRGQELAEDLEDLRLEVPPRSRAALRKATPPEAKPVVPAVEPAALSTKSELRKTPTVKTEPMASWPLVATTVRLFPFLHKARPQNLLLGSVVMLVAVAAGAFAWQLREASNGLTSTAGMQPPPGLMIQANDGPRAGQGPRRAAAKPATLFVVGEHGFREATLQFFAGDKPVGQVELTSKEGESTRFSTSLSMKPGEYPLTVIAKEGNGGFDQTATIDGEFVAGKNRHLEVKVSRSAQSIWMGKKLALRWLN